MRVHVFPADTAGCGHYRMIWPAETLRALGHDVHVMMPGEQDSLPVTVIDTVRSRSVILDTDDIGCDVLVLQRPLNWRWQHIVPQVQALGVRVVIDLDDDIAALRPAHVLYGSLDPTTNREDNWWHMRNAMLRADAVTVSTSALAHRYGRAPSVTVIPNCVPDHYLDVTVERTDGPPVVGWTGSVQTHPHDLNVLGPSLPNVRREAPFEWRVVGNGVGVRAAMGLDPVVVPYVPIEQYPTEVARFDVGVVPLALHPFNHAKSWLKGLEMASVGVPFIASPTDPYVDLTARGAGLLADKPKVWAWQLRRLLTDEAFRSETVAANRDVARLYTFGVNAWRWEEVWLGDR